MRPIARKLVALFASAWITGGIAPLCSAKDARFNKSVASATTIVVGRLDQYIAEPESLDRLVEQQLRSSNGFSGNPAAVVMNTVQPRGTYVFTIVSTLSGHPPEPLIVRLPRVSGYVASGFASIPKPRIPLKARYLLLLSGDETAGFKATSIAPIPISEQLSLPKAPIDASDPNAAVSAVTHLLVDSLADPAVRDAAGYFLSDCESDDAVKAMRAYVDDPSDSLRSSVLECMATNQDVTAIPKIAAWSNTAHSAGGSVLLALSKYKTPAAIPYLNPLITDSKSQYTRLNAVMALRQIVGDKTSIPFLIKALRDPENSLVAADAYYALCKIVPELGPGKLSGFNVPEAEIAKFEKWWADEQAGKH